MAKRQLKFEGKTYTKCSKKLSQNDAEALVVSLRQQGFGARYIKVVDNNTWGGFSYIVYKRKKR